MGHVPQLEPLETRRLFVVFATAGNDVVHVTFIDDDPATFRVLVNGVVADEGPVDLADPGRFVEVDCLGGNDTFTVDPRFTSRIIVHGGAGNDTLAGGNARDRLNGGDGNDIVFGKSNVDVLHGDAGDDTLRGGSGGTPDVLFGDAGADLLFGESGDDHLEGGDGNDLLNGGEGFDALHGGPGDDQIFGMAGNDTFLTRLTLRDNLADRGNDTLDGGDGIDTFEFAATAGPAFLSNDGVANDGLAGERMNVMPNVERFLTLGLLAGSVVDMSKSPSGVDVIVSHEGTPPATPVLLIGSRFDDILQTPGGPIGVPIAQSTLRIEGGDGNDRIFGGNAAETLVGGAGNDTIRGGPGHDVILGDDGADFIEGHGGSDRIAAGVGNDIVYGDFENISDPDDPTVYAGDTLEGNAGNDILIGNGGNDRIWGHGGRDTLVGGGGNDTMFGGPDAADTLRGGPGNDSAAQDEKDLYDSVEVMLV